MSILKERHTLTYISPSSVTPTKGNSRFSRPTKAMLKTTKVAQVHDGCLFVEAQFLRGFKATLKDPNRFAGRPPQKETNAAARGARRGGPCHAHRRPGKSALGPWRAVPDSLRRRRPSWGVSGGWGARSSDERGSLHYTPEHCLVNGGFPLFWWKEPCFKWAKCIF